MKQHDCSAMYSTININVPIKAMWAGLFLALILVTDAAAQNYWTGGVNDWFDPATYWSLGAFPLPTDTAVVNNGGTAQVSAGEAATASTLYMGDTTGAGNASVQGSGSSLTVGGDILIGTQGNAGSFTLSSGGTVTANRLFIGASGSYSDDASGSLVITSGANTPTIENDSSSPVTINSAVTLQASATVNAASGNLTFTGVIGDGGGGYGLNVNGPFTLTLTAANTYSGGTTLNGGTLAVGNDSALGSGTLTMNGGTLDVQDGLTHTLNNAVTLQNNGTINTTSGNLTLNGVIGESGGSYGLIANGSGTLTLMAANTYSGGVTLNGGTLAVGNDFALGSGTLIMNGGTLDVQDGLTHTLNNAVTLQNNGTINTTSGNLTLNGVIGESGGSYGLIANGPGTLTLTAANTYSVGTLINGGTLAVQNASALGVGNVYLVGGAMAVNPLTLNIGGSYNQSGGTLQLAVGGTGAGQFSQLNITGAATINGGTLQVVQSGGYQPKNLDQVTLLVSSGLAGSGFSSFNNLIPASPLLQANLTTDPSVSDLILTWTQNSFVPYALTPNQQAVARNLDATANDPRMTAVINGLDYLPGGTSQLPGVFDLISPAQLTSMFALGFAGADVQGYNLMNRLGDLRAGSTGFSASGLNLDNPTGTLDLVPQFMSPQPADVHATDSKGIWRQTPDNPWGVFVGGAGEFIGVNGDQNASGYHVTSGGLSVGADYRLSDQLAVGLALGYANSTASLAGDGRITVNSGRADAYSVWFNDGFYMEGMAGGGYSGYDTRRQGLGAGGTTSMAAGNTDGGEIEGLLGGGYDWRKGPWTFGPQALLQYTRVDINSFTESGSLLPLQIQSQSADSLQSQLGAHVMYQTEVGKVVLTPELRLGWKHEYLDRDVALDSRFANGAGNVFTVYGPQLGRDSAVVGVGLSARWTRDISTYINYDSELGRANYSLQSVSAGVRIRL